MALPSYTVVMTALSQIAAAALDDPTDPGSRQVWNALDEVAAALQQLSKSTYSNLSLPRQVFTGVAPAAGIDGVTQYANASDGEYASATALIAGLGLVPGDYFVLQAATNDVTDNALATAKSGATAVGDVFVVLTTSTVLYVATVAALGA